MHRTKNNSYFSWNMLLASVLFSTSLIAQTSGSTPNELRGQWVLRSFYRTPNVWGISLKQAQSLIGSKLIYENRKLRACKQQVSISEVNQHDVGHSEFLAGRNNVHFEDVGINTESVREIAINRDAGGNCFGTYALPGEDVYLKNSGELLVDFEGVYFRATRLAARNSAK